MQNRGSDDQPPSFEAALEQLEAIVHRLEDGDVGLAEALQHYEQAVQYLRHCYQSVEKAQRRIEILCGIDADGNPVVEPFDEEQETTLAKKAAQRGQRRTRKPAPAPTPGGDMLQNDIDDAPRLF